MAGLDRVRRALRDYRPVADTDPAAHAAAVAVVLHEGAEGLAALFIKRAARVGDPWSGQIAFPGGRFQSSDGELLTTAIREAREETGIDLGGAEGLGPLDDVNPRTPVLPPIVVRPFVFVVAQRPSLVTSPEEVERAFWLSFAVLETPETRGQITLTLRGEERTFPAYQIGGEVIWGMTERILTPFLQLLI